MLCITCTSAFADWANLTYSANSTVFIDESSIRRKGDIIEVRQLFNFHKAQKSHDNLVTYNSSIGWEAYNCKTRQDRTISFAWYSGGMGKGKTVHIDKGHDDYRWEDIMQGSLADAIRKKVCN